MFKHLNGATYGVWAKVLQSLYGWILGFRLALINPLTRQWEKVLIKDIFSVVDANIILFIPLSLNGFDDFVAWHFNKSGTFSVKSAYHVEMEAPGQQLCQSNGVILGGPKSYLAKSLQRSLPVKIKKFCWRALHATIQVRAVLLRRHVLFTCAPAKHLWRALRLEERIISVLPVHTYGSQMLEEPIDGSVD